MLPSRIHRKYLRAYYITAIGKSSNLSHTESMGLSAVCCMLLVAAVCILLGDDLLILQQREERVFEYSVALYNLRIVFVYRTTNQPSHFSLEPWHSSGAS